MEESIGGTLIRSPVMPMTVGTHDFAARIKASRAWRALARHDEVGASRAVYGAVIVGRASVSPDVLAQRYN